MFTKWTDFVHEIKNKEEYINLLGQSGSTPRDFFNDVIMVLTAEFKKNKKILKQILRENTIKFASNISYEAYNDILVQYKEYASIRADMKPVLYDYLIRKVKEKEREHNKREIKIANKMYSYIQRKKLVIANYMEFEEALPLIRQHKKFMPISDENLRFAFLIVKEMVKNNVKVNEGESMVIKRKGSENDNEKEDGEMSGNEL
jgi:hypothetical protein